MAVSAHVQACIDDILTAVYGRDVRQAIHDAVEYAVGIVGTYGSRLDDDEANINTLSGRISLNQQTISSLGQTVSNHESRIGTLERSITTALISGTTDDYVLNINLPLVAD